MRVPRFFVSSTSSPAREAKVDDPRTIDDVLAVVRLVGSFGEQELIIGCDAARRPCAVPMSARDGLGDLARAKLAYHEVAMRTVPTIEAEELFLFDLQIVELLRDAPGLDDPLYLYGALRGPYPSSLELGAPSCDGQLTVTRALLLEALVAGVASAFAVEPRTAGSRCVHVLVPAEPLEPLRAGRGLVLAIPITPASIGGGAANDRLIAQILHDVLRAMRKDLGQEAPPLPVPDRRVLEQELRNEGWDIEGDVAVRRKGLLSRDERRALPPQGTVEDYVREASAILARLPDWPSPAMAELRRRTAPHVASSPLVARPPPAPPAPIARADAPRPVVHASPDEWIRDFVVEHATPDRPRPRLSRPARAAEERPDWMRDFDDAAEETDVRKPGAPPDWKKDFE